MLKFDSSHEKLWGRIRRGGWLEKGLMTIVAGCLAFSIALPIVEINSMKAPCDVDGDHAHLYIDPESKIERYIDSEYKQYHGLVRTDDYIELSKEEAQELKFMNQNDLFRIDQNVEQLQMAEEKLQDQKEYRFSYTETIHWSTPIKMGKGWSVIHHQKDVTRYSWTNDKTKNLTGEERDVHYMYYAYKVTQDENGNYSMEKSELVNDFSELPEGYNYISRDFFRAVDPVTHQVLKYEDGSINDVNVATNISLNRLGNEEQLDYMIDEYQFVDDLGNIYDINM